MKKFDVGGMLVTLYRLFNDTVFIGKLEEEFIVLQILLKLKVMLEL